MKAYNRYSQENFFEQHVRKVFLLFHRVLRGIANNVLNSKVIRGREFSNAILRYYAPLFTGKVINVSGWNDSDFENGFYKTYFTKATKYFVSNAPDCDTKGVGSYTNEILIDLEKVLDPGLEKKFDVVFNHTTLEHVFDLDTAFRNLCLLSRDVVIIVVPTLQHIHTKSGFGDYNRPTPLGIAKYFEKYDFENVVIQSNEQPFSPIYCFAIATRKGSKYIDMIEKSLEFSMGGQLYGSTLKNEQALLHLNSSKESRDR